MIRRIAGIAFVIVMMFAFPVILLAEDVSLDTLAVWVKEIAYEQDRQSERIDALEERVELLSAALTPTPKPAPTGPPPTGRVPSEGPSIPGGENPAPGGESSTIPTEVATPIPAPTLWGYATHYLLGSIDLTWDAIIPDDSSTPNIPYELQVRSLGGQWRTINHARPYISSFQHTRLESGVTYYYRVRAIPYLEEPSPWSTTVWIRTLRPDEISTPTPVPTPSS